MTKRTFLWLAALTGVPSSTPAAQGAPARPLDPNCERLLPAAVVAKLSGDADLKLIAPGAVPAAGGTCNYAVGGQTVILYVELNTTADARTFQRYKTSRSYQEGQQGITGLGDEAFSATPSDQPVVIARKGKTLVALLGMLDLDPKSPRFAKAHLTGEQLVELARQMLGSS